MKSDADSDFVVDVINQIELSLLLINHHEAGVAAQQAYAPDCVVAMMNVLLTFVPHLRPYQLLAACVYEWFDPVGHLSAQILPSIL